MVVGTRVVLEEYGKLIEREIEGSDSYVISPVSHTYFSLSIG